MQDSKQAKNKDMSELTREYFKSKGFLCKELKSGFSIDIKDGWFGLYVSDITDSYDKEGVGILTVNFGEYESPLEIETPKEFKDLYFLFTKTKI